ncbi:hypothetical protein A3A09_03115 [Candidatus Nomurabacteria bacterium RIFCSPLOWO2_01_FULL_42_20]|uniref:Acylphosphatase n=1 Tax=Candidatus Nomurabacteria bacterium RIFCSPHIGHO2_01_FULL_42_16 TaxID=1801743 RepID=A0A1F6VJF6_9BACT|nr:MAG: hypothetical protein A2824_03215 [Candidatus Nomurabacteria bacterium RIFCSPHIGHO2_01_FULL_42_16]OGI92605.1 MAG: hypothetical protein A3A09_03115 [Candidatus Nomurabacteria bacterium RIFCSPLOWO2_01_FULL_42_20]
MRHINLKIYGQVQGVFFRQGVKDMALELGLAGFVRNEPDGSVYLEIEGEESALEKMAEFCRKGPPGAKVNSLDISEGAVQNFTGFNIV